MGSSRLPYFVQLPCVGLIDGLRLAGWPADHGLVDARVLAQAEVQAPLILRGEAAASGHFLDLLLTIPVDRHLRPDRAAIARRAFQLELDPRILRRDRILVNQERPVLMRDD